MCTLVKWTCNAVITCVLLLAVTGLAFAIDNPDNSALSGTGGYVDVVASVTQVGGAHPFKFEYTYTFAEWYANVNLLTIGNPKKISYWDAGSNKSAYFSNPIYDSRSTSIKWQLLNSTALYPVDSGPITVWYYADSSNVQGVSVSVTGEDGVQASAPTSDYTLGMTTPEPGSLAAMGFGLMFFGSTFIRLKRR